MGKLDALAALLAFVAAVFWFLSAYGDLPPIGMYWDKAPESDPFFQAVRFSAVMNKWAAGFSGGSALCVALRLLIR